MRVKQICQVYAITILFHVGNLESFAENQSASCIILAFLTLVEERLRKGIKKGALVLFRVYILRPLSISIGRSNIVEKRKQHLL